MPDKQLENELDEDEDEDEEEEEEEPPPVGQQEILSLREKLKTEIRRKNQAQQGASAGMARCSSSILQMQAPVKDRYGTFFGPSRPSLSRRVIDEGCSSIMKEMQKPSSKSTVSSASEAQPTASSQQQKSKAVSQEKRKVDALKQNRDYSCLFSDDADTQPTKEQPHSMSALPLKSDNGPTHSAGNMVFTSQPARVSKDSGLKGAVPPIQRRDQWKGPLPNKKRLIESAKNGSSLPAMKKTQRLQSPTNGQKPQQAMQSKRPQSLPSQRKVESSQIQREQSHGQQSSLQCRKPKPSINGQHSGQKVSAQSLERSRLTQKQSASSSKLKPPRPISSNADYNDHGKTRRNGLLRKVFAQLPEVNCETYSPNMC